MKRTLLIYLICLTSTIVYGQKKAKEVIQKIPMADGLIVDGDLSDWKGGLQMVDVDTSWSYALAYDADHLYVSVRVSNQYLQREVVQTGVTFGINMLGKKKEGATLTYPRADNDNIRELLQSEELTDKNFRKRMINTAKGYQVAGFPTIVDGSLSFKNSYGIRAHMTIDTGDNLCYEAAIPLKQLNLAPGHQDPIAIQIGVSDPRSVSAKNSRQRNSLSRSDSNQQLKTKNKTQTEVWILASLLQD